jgi:hypothetical protein
VLRALRKLVLGETWTLPVGIAVAVAAAFLVREAAGASGWWHEAGGFVLLAFLVVAFLAALRFRR